MHLNFQGDRKSDGKFFISRTIPRISSGACAPLRVLLCGPLTSLEITNQLFGLVNDWNRHQHESSLSLITIYIYQMFAQWQESEFRASLITDETF